jgi:AcrR family transcriptional regulator
MARQVNPRPVPRVPLSRDRVLRAAIKLADEGGIEALSMRRLGQELGVEAMSLYNHVANKDEVLDGIIEAVASEIEAPADGAHWKAALRQSAISAHEVLLRHPWAAGMWFRRGDGPGRFQHADLVLGCFREAGFSKDLTYHAFHIFEAHILGFTLQQLSFPYDNEELAELATTFLRELPAEQYPHLTEHVLQHLEPRQNDEGAFELGLDLILDGLERIRDTA